ncbi:MAG: apolipoprotein N-acyltransferase [Methyloprofundus sp.]|nr:MAG: apolipoprotein N-acyltransferase [Methyloprofundus sp.]
MQKLFKSAWGHVFAVIVGILFTLSFSPFDLPVLVFVALAIFRRLLIELNVQQALLRGFLFGLGIFGSGVSWVFVSMVVNDQTSFIMPALMTLFYCSFWAIFPALAAYLYIKLQKNNSYDWLLFATVWVFVEFIRGEWVLNGFPWLQVAYSQLDTPLATYIPIVGVYGAGFITVIIAALLAEIWLMPRHRKLCLLSIMLFFLVGLLLNNINWTKVEGELIKVTLIQGNIAQKDKWALENRNIILKQYYDDSAEYWDSDIIIWPETAIPAYYSDVKDDYLLPLEQEALLHNTDIITSLPYKDTEGRLYNSVLVLGKNRAMYKKMHLLPFGEYLPWQPISGYVLGLMDIRLGNFSAGEPEQTLLQAAGHAFVTSICYEDAFGEQSIRSIEQAKFLVNVTNDGWFDGSIEPYQHMQIARMRALESGRYLLRVTNTGVTAIVSAKGKIIKRAPVRERYTITADIPPMTGLTPYARMGDKPVIALVLLMLLGAALNKYLNIRVKV